MVKYSVNKELSWRKLGDQTVILDTTTNKQVHHLNETASVVWEGLTNKLSINEIADNMQKQFYDCSDNILEDIEQIITSFKSKNLLNEK